MPTRNDNVLSWASELESEAADQAARTSRLPFLAGHLGVDLHADVDFDNNRGEMPLDYRIKGTYRNQPLTAQHTSELVRAIMNDRQATEFEKTKECNFAISPAGTSTRARSPS